MYPLELSIHTPRETLPVINVKGEVDIYTAPRLRSTMIELIDQGNCNLILNLREVQYMDSAGLGVLVSALKRVMEQEGSINLIAPHENVLRVLRITRLDRILNTFYTEQQAIDSVLSRELEKTSLAVNSQPEQVTT